MKSRFRLVLILLAAAAVAVGLFTVLYRPGILKPTAARTEVYVVIKTNDVETNFFWKSFRDGTAAAGRDLAADVRILAPDKETDIDGQIALVRRAVAAKPDGIVLAAADVDRLVPAAAEARRAGIVLVSVDSFLASDDAQARIGTDNLAAGAKLGFVAASLLPPGSPVALMSYVATTSTAIDRERGVRSAIGDRLDLAETLYSTSDQAKAYAMTAELLARRPELAAVITLNLPTTLGAAQALAESPRARSVRLFGFDTSIEVVGYLESGVIAAAVAQKPFNMGYLAVKAVVDLAAGRPTAAAVDTGSNVVDLSNLYDRENQRLLFPVEPAAAPAAAPR
jgi:ribose transport system substrate-binding protein